MLNAADLADAIQASIGRGGEPTTSVIQGLASAIVDHLMSASISFLPGTVTGNAPPAPGPISNGAATMGVISLVPSALETGLLAVFGSSTSQIMGLADAISATVSAGTAEFPSGNIVGASTAVGPPTPAPGVFLGSGTNGTVEGVIGSNLDTQLIAALGGTSSEISNFSSAITSYTEDNSIVTLPVASGVVAVAGGPINAGIGSGGFIS